MRATEIRDAVIDGLRKEMGNLAVAELNGNYFAGADIAVNDKDGDPEVYRIAVISHKPQKEFA